MKTEVVTSKKKMTWGYVKHPKHDGHFYTGYSEPYYYGGTLNPKANMHVGENVVITGEFKITSMGRGRSAAYFGGSFRHHDDVNYDVSMSGMFEYIQMLQECQDIDNEDGYVLSEWTFAKQGQQIFLKPLRVL